jgi:putative ABC transport system permease protein
LLETIKSVPGVKVVIPVDLSGGDYQRPDQKVGIVAIRSDAGWLSAFTFHVAPQYEESFRRMRTGALIREHLAARYGWKVGDHIPLQSKVTQVNGSTDWGFDVVGTYTDSDVGGGKDTILVNYSYFDEARVTDRGTVAHFNVAVTDPRLAQTVADEIDRRFANSASETETNSLRELAQSQMQSIGDMNFLIRAIVTAVLVALLFATATTLMQSIRERTAELAVLKTLGFADHAVLFLILAEAISVFLVAAAGGLALALVVFPLASKFVPGLSMPGGVVIAGLASALLAAAVSALVPAVQAARLKIAVALAAR